MPKKDKRVTVPLIESQFELWKYWADQKEISLPEFIRRGITIYIKMLEKYKGSEKMQ